MCRWLAYSGSPVLLDELLFKSENSLVVQSKHSRLGAETTNGDGFGVGWYGAQETPGIYHSTSPAWNDQNLRELAAHAAPAASSPTSGRPTGTRGPADQLSPLPVRALALDAQRGHFGLPGLEARPDAGRRAGPLPGYRRVDGLRALLLPRPDLRAQDDPPSAVARAVGVIEETGRRHGIEFPLQMTVATTDGETTWAFRYSSEGRSRSLFHSTDIATLKAPVPR